MLSIERDSIIEVFDSIESENVLRVAYGVISGSFRFARNHHIIQMSPEKSAIKAKKMDMKKAEMDRSQGEVPNKKPKTKKVLSTDQISHLLYVCKNEEPKIFIPLLLAVTAGLRISEVIGIKYSDIDFGNNELHMDRQLGRSTSNEGLEEEEMLIQELEPKTHNSVRCVPLADFVMDEIILQRQRYEELRSNFSDFRDLGYLCCRENGVPYHRSFAGPAFKRLLKSCGFEDMQWRFLRNTYATVLAEYEISIKAIAVCLGHYSPVFTNDTYVDATKIVYDVAVEITDFATDVLPGQKTVLDIDIDRTYLLEVLPQNVYNI